MIKFRYFYNGAFHFGFARQFTIEDKFRYLIILKDGLSLVITSTTSQSADNKIAWLQIPRASETVQLDDLVQAVGAGLQDGELI